VTHIAADVSTYSVASRGGNTLTLVSHGPRPITEDQQMTLPTPIVGDWYQGRDGELFEVVAIDNDDHTIEVQFFDGTLEEFENGDWIALSPQTAEAPEDWTGSLDIDPEEWDDDTDLHATQAWLGSEHLDRDEANGFSEWPQLRN
jgi:hypothetical protein